MRPKLSNEEIIANHYKAAMDSVNLINSIFLKEEKSEEDIKRMRANQEHLKIMLAKDFWTSENLRPLQDAAAR